MELAQTYTADELQARMTQLSNALTERYGVYIEILESDNGDDDWIYPVHAMVEDDDDAYALCDIGTDTIANQVQWMAFQLEDSSHEMRLRTSSPIPREGSSQPTARNVIAAALKNDQESGYVEGYEMYRVQAALVLDALKDAGYIVTASPDKPDPAARRREMHNDAKRVGVECPVTGCGFCYDESARQAELDETARLYREQHGPAVDDRESARRAADEYAAAARLRSYIDALTAAGYVVMRGVSLFGDTTCPVCGGEGSAQWPDDDNGSCDACMGNGSGVFLAYVDDERA